MAFRDFSQFSVWRKAFHLLVQVYECTRAFPKEERYGMISDMRRAANSVAHNIAEGFGRYEKRDKTRFYKISRGSAYELISQVMASNALDFLPADPATQLDNGYREVIEELDRLIKAIEAR